MIKKKKNWKKTQHGSEKKNWKEDRDRTQRKREDSLSLSLSKIIFSFFLSSYPPFLPPLTTTLMQFILPESNSFPRYYLFASNSFYLFLFNSFVRSFNFNYLFLKMPFLLKTVARFYNALLIWSLYAHYNSSFNW